MQLTIVTEEDKILAIEVDKNEQVENLKALLEVETSIPLPSQILVFNGRELRNEQRLTDVGVGEGDMLMLVLNNPGRSQSGSSPNVGLDPATGTARDPAALMAYFSQPDILSNLRQSFPEMAQAVARNDIERMQSLLRQQHQMKQEREIKRREELELLNADPFDIDAQRRIEEAIHQKNIDENWEQAIEYNPEAFARVVMLYVDADVNGHPLKAFVDSGAQMTIMSRSCAERCNLLRLVDKRYTGIAKGVGSSKILGKVHLAPLKMGGHYFECSFTILEQNDVEFIFGLDMLRKHQCMIDLKEGCLRIGGGDIAVPFLQEKDIPHHLLGSENEAGTSERGKELAPAGTAQASTAGGPSTAAGSGTTSQPGDNEDKIKRLMELGFTRDKVVEALMVCDYNEEHAASLLFGGS